MVPLIINEPTIMATNPPTIKTNNFPMSLILANVFLYRHSNYKYLKLSIRFNNDFDIFLNMTRKQQVVAWIAMVGGCIGFFFFSIEMAEFMR